MIALSSSLLALGISSVSFAANPTSGLQSCGGFELGISGFYSRPGPHGLDYTIRDTQDIDLLLDDGAVVPNGRIKTLDPDYDWNYEAHVGYVFPCIHSDIVLTYRNFNESNHAFTDARAGSFVWATHFPPEILDEFVDSPAGDQAIASLAIVDYDYRRWSLEFGHYVPTPCCGLNLRFLVGIDNVDLERKINRCYFDLELNGALAASTISNGNQNERSEFDAWGPRIGVDAEYCLYQGLAIVGHFNTTLFVGDEDYHFLAKAVDTDGELVDPLAQSVLHGKFKDRVVPNINTKLGLDYTFRFCNRSRTSLVIEAGYQVDHFFDAFRGIKFSGESDDEVGVSSTEYSNFELQGPYIGLTVVI